MFVCAIAKKRFLVDWRLGVEEPITNNCLPLEFFVVVVSRIYSLMFFWGFWIFAIRLLCIMGESSGSGRVDVTVGVSYR